jgi:hypothetical protein
VTTFLNAASPSTTAFLPSDKVFDDAEMFGISPDFDIEDDNSVDDHDTAGENMLNGDVSVEGDDISTKDIPQRRPKLSGRMGRSAKKRTVAARPQLVPESVELGRKSSCRSAKKLTVAATAGE